MEKRQEKISVIVPVYNVKDVLNRCIESIVTQTYKNLEIILVDDGSTDGSEKLCEEWSQKDVRIKVLHKKNGGAASARNVALDIAEGDYIGFVDSDDYIGEDMYEILLENMENNVDITCCGTVTQYLASMKKRYTLYDYSPKKRLFSNSEAVTELLLLRYLSFSPCDKLFRRELFYDLRFPTGKVCEDLPTIYEAIKKSRMVVNVGKIKYFYCYREDSVSRKEFSRERLHYVLFTRDIFQDVCVAYPELRRAAEERYICNLIHIMNQIKECKKEKEYKRIYKRFKKLLFRMQIHIFTNQYIEKGIKIEVIRQIWSKPISIFGVKHLKE